MSRYIFEDLLMLDLLKPLAELEEKWRSYRPHPTTPISETQHRCADELAAVRAEVEREVEKENYAFTVLVEATKGLLARAERAEAELSKLRSQLEQKESKQ